MKPTVLTVTMNPAIDKTVTVDRVELAQLNRIKEMRMDAGGKGINVAKALKSFSVDAIAWGIVGGYQGQVIQDNLQQAGIDCNFLMGPGETRVNMKVIDETTQLTTEFNEPGIRLNQDLLREFTARFSVGLYGMRYVVLGGSLPPGAPSDYYQTLIHTASMKGVPTILDADGEAFAQGLEAAPYAIKPNIHELEGYFDRKFHTDADIVTAARLLIATKGIHMVLVSMGGSGSILVNASEVYRAMPFPIVPLSTVGAGDSMVAAMVYGLLHQYSLESICRLTSAAGTITASKPGTQMCTIQEVKMKQDLVVVTNV